MFENTPIPERRITAQEVAAMIRQNGKENVEAKTILNQWLDQTQGQVERGEITNLERNVAWAELYRNAGLVDEAVAAFTDAAEQAWQEHNDAVFQQCQNEIGRLRGTT